MRLSSYVPVCTCGCVGVGVYVYIWVHVCVRQYVCSCVLVYASVTYVRLFVCLSVCPEIYRYVCHLSTALYCVIKSCMYIYH